MKLAPALGASRPSTFIWLLLIAIAICAINIAITPERFYDYVTYLEITDRIYYFPGAEFTELEIGSNLFFITIRNLTGSTVTTVDLAHYLLGLLFIGMSFFLAKRHDISWQGVILFFALYGPLLAFVTIRATPAYFLVALAALEANRGKLTCIPILAASFLFHVSVVLALPAIMVSLLQNRYSWLSWLKNALLILIAGGVIYLILTFFFLGALVDTFAIVANSVPFLSKYVVHIESLTPTAAALQADAAIDTTKHYLYLAAATAFVLLFVLQREERCVAFRGYMVVSYTVFVFMQFSAVASYRQSLYWMIPAILLFPWPKFTRGIFFSTLFVAGCAILFVLNLQTVYL